MGIRYHSKTKNQATLKLMEQISSFLFEQEFGELNNQPLAKQKLKEAIESLKEIVKKG